jgi:hypothetical protein
MNVPVPLSRRAFVAASVGVTALASLAVDGMLSPAGAAAGTELWLLRTAGAQTAVEAAVRNAVASQL